MPFNKRADQLQADIETAIADRSYTDFDVIKTEYDNVESLYQHLLTPDENALARMNRITTLYEFLDNVIQFRQCAQRLRMEIDVLENKIDTVLNQDLDYLDTMYLKLSMSAFGIDTSELGTKMLTGDLADIRSKIDGLYNTVKERLHTHINEYISHFCTKLNDLEASNHPDVANLEKSLMLIKVAVRNFEHQGVVSIKLQNTISELEQRVNAIVEKQAASEENKDDRTGPSLTDPLKLI